MEKTAYEAAAAVIAVSHGMREDILKCYPSINPEHVPVVHNGIDSTDWQPDTSDAARSGCARSAKRENHVRSAPGPSEVSTSPKRPL